MSGIEESSRTHNFVKRIPPRLSPVVVTDTNLLSTLSPPLSSTLQYSICSFDYGVIGGLDDTVERSRPRRPVEHALEDDGHDNEGDKDSLYEEVDDRVWGKGQHRFILKSKAQPIETYT